MGRKHVAAVLVVLLPGCGAIKHTSKAEGSVEQTEKTMLKQKMESDIHSDEKSASVFMEADSTRLAFEIEILPVGPFNFSPYKGFEGTAQKIIWHGNADQLSKMMGLQQRKMSLASTEKTILDAAGTKKLAEKVALKTREVERPLSWKWLLAGAGILFLLLFGYFKIRG